MRKYLIAICILFVQLATAVAQPYYFRHYQVEQGLSHNSVFCSVQDNNGFVWFGTKDGLNRFDGYRFKSFHIDRNEDGSFSRDQITSLAVDNSGKLWIGTLKGLYYFDAEREQIVAFNDTLPYVADLCIDGQGTLWFTSGLDLCRYDAAKGTIVTYPSGDFFAVTTILSRNNTLWLGTSDGYLVNFDPSTQTSKKYYLFARSAPTSFGWIEKIADGQDGYIYIGTVSDGIKRFHVEQSDYQDLLSHNPDRTSIYVRDILKTDTHEMWFATESGIFIFDMRKGGFTNLRKKYLDKYSLSDNAVYSLQKDKEGGIWAGTYFGGINYYASQSSVFQKIYPDYSANSMTGNVVREICADRYGNIWMATEDAGLNKLNPVTGEIQQFTPSAEAGSIAHSNIHGLLVVGDELWIGTFEHGLDILNIRTGKVKKRYRAGKDPHQLKSNFIVSFLRTRSGDIYLGTSSEVVRYNKEADGFDVVPEFPPGNFFANLIEDHRGTIWAATHGSGVLYFNPSTGENGALVNIPDNYNSITTNTVNTVFEDSSYNLWFATEGGGLCMLGSDRKTFRRYSTDTGLPSNFVFKVLEDNFKNLWITTSKGLVSLNVASGATMIFTSSNGLLNDQFNYNSGFRDKKGSLYFGSVHGLIRFHPASIIKKTFVPPVFITGFQVHGKEVNIATGDDVADRSILFANRISLPHDRSSFSIDFAAISFSSPEMTDYSYMMEGLDKSWTNIRTNRKVYFTNLEPGSYTFKVKASGPGFSGTQERSLSIRIMPPLWKTPVAYILYVVLGGMMFYQLVRVYHKIQENKKQKEIYEAKIEFFTNIAHEIKTPLTLIKGPVENLAEMVSDHPEIGDDVITMERNTNRLLNLTNQILDFRQVEAKGFSLDFSEVNVSEQLRDAYLTFEPLAKKKNGVYTMELPPADVITLADAEALNKILSNLFTNAIKYSDKVVRISLSRPAKDDEYLIVNISNDGFLIPADMREKIFEPFYRLKQSVKQKGTGIGLALARSLTELHEGKLFVNPADSNMNEFILALPNRKYAKKTLNLKVQPELLKSN